MADQPVTTPPLLGFQFDSGAIYTRLAILKPGKIWNVTAAAWEDYPPSGNPLAAHAITPTRFGPAGVASQLYDAALPVTRDQLAGGGVLIYAASDVAGTYQTKIRYVGLEYLQEGGTTIYADGATFYIR